MFTTIATLFMKWVAGKWFKPVLGALAAALVLWYLWSSFNSWKKELYDNGYNKARAEMVVEHEAKLQVLRDEVNKLTIDSAVKGDALDKQNKSFRLYTDSLIKQIQNSQVPLVITNGKGDCKPTSEASDKWNILQKSLQR